jgi:hypothetical protein
MQPFLHNQVFGVNTSLTLKLESIGGVPVVMVDNIFKDMAIIREIVLNTPVGNWKYKSQGRNYKDYYDARISYPPMQTELYDLTKTIIKNTYKKDTTLRDGLNVNWFKQIQTKRANYAFPHHDKYEGQEQYTCLVYLNTEEESSGGTAFFKNKITKNIDGTKLEDIKFTKDYPETCENGMDYWSSMNYWDIVGYVSMKPNRLVIFPAQYYHASYHPQDSFYTFPRLTLVYWMQELVSF